ncbi:MAG: LysR family transcriptional regulator [Gammaproteobacteria bacterium]
MKDLAFDWNDLKFFLAVARARGLSGAATLLGTSASTVSRHVSALEARLGATLFLRQQTGYLLTDDGTSLLAHIEEVEQAMVAVERRGQAALQEDVSGQVRLATTEMLAVHMIAPHLGELRARHPRLQVELKIALTRADLSRREADLALRLVAPQPDDGGADYIGTPVGELAFALYGAADGPPGDDWRGGDYVSWDDSWSELPMVKWLASAFAGKAPALASNSLQAQYAAVRAGVGVGVLPCFLADHDPTVRRLEQRPEMTRPLWLVWHRDLKASRRVQAMREFLVDLIERHLHPA